MHSKSNNRTSQINTMMQVQSRAALLGCSLLLVAFYNGNSIQGFNLITNKLSVTAPSPVHTSDFCLHVSASSSSVTRSRTQRADSDDSDDEVSVPKQKTLYEILSAKPTDTRNELKKSYIALARQSHPDALIGKDKEMIGNMTAAMSDDFSAIAAAWRILSDPKQRKRYDRSLQAQQLSDNISNWADNLFTKKAAPAAVETSLQLLEKVAVPFLRRTTATTIATVKAVTGKKTSDTSSTNQFSWKSAAKAAFKVNEEIDRMELEEESTDLEQRAVRKYQKALEIENELLALGKRSVVLALQIENSGMTSSEASLLLKGIKHEKSILDDLEITPTDAILLKHGGEKIELIENQIYSLQAMEEKFVETQQMDYMNQERYQEQVRLKLQKEATIQQCKKKEEEARLRYEQAMQRLIDEKMLLDRIQSELKDIENEAKMTSLTLEEKSIVIEEQSEVVRLSLMDIVNPSQDDMKQDQTTKQFTSYNNIGRNNNMDSYEKQYKDSFPITEEMNRSFDVRLQELTELRQLERELSTERSRLEQSAARLLDQSNDLKQKVTSNRI